MEILVIYKRVGIYTSALLLEHLFTGCFKIIVKLAFHVKVIRISRIIREKRILTPFHISNMGYGSSHDFVTPCFSRFPRLKTRSRVYSPESWTTWRILYQVSIKKIFYSTTTRLYGQGVQEKL